MATKYIFIILCCLQYSAYAQIEIEDKSYKEDYFEDLVFLKEELKDKTIICLGEEWHRTETFSELKNRIVKYLHQELDYKHIIFESSIYSPWVVTQDQLKGKERLFETLQTIWRTESVLDLMEYIDESEGSKNAISQNGIDLQGAYTDVFSNKIITLFKNQGEEFLTELSRTESLVQEEWIKKHQTFKKYKSKVSEKEIAMYEKLITILKTSEEPKIEPVEKDRILWLIQNRIFLCKSLIDDGGKYYREQILSKNLEWMIKNIGENEKIIVWAADIHISKKQSKTYKGAEKSMLELLPPNYLEKVYSLSLIPVKSTPKKIKKKLNKEKGRFYFYSTSEENDMSNKKEEFDGVIVCKKTESIDKYMINGNKD